VDRVSAPLGEGAGIAMPKRESDCSGQRPSWFPFGVNVEACDLDNADPVPFFPRELALPVARAIPWSPE
jgi:hypothetical protein